MTNYPIRINTQQLTRELGDFSRQLSKGAKTLRKLREQDIQLGATPKELVYREDKLKLYRFTPLVDKPFPIPVFIVYSVVSRHTMTDLQEDRSMIRNLLGQGLDVYLVDWGYPTPVDRWLTVDDYVNGYLDNCVDYLRERHGLEQINLLGICQGGVLSLCYTALHSEKIKNLILTLTPVDFHADQEEQDPSLGLVNLWQRNIDVDLLIEAMGNVPGDYMAYSFAVTKPFLNTAKYATSLVDVLDDEAKLTYFLRMEKWIADNPDYPAESCRQWMKDLYQDNKLVKGTFELGGRRVDLKNITLPVLNIYADQDHIVPPKTSTALAKHIASKDYTEMALPGGHIGVYVGGKTQKILGPGVAKWIKERA